jgi:hypothetical protein
MATPRPLDDTLARMDYGRALKRELLMQPRPDPAMPYARPLPDTIDLFDQLGIAYALIGGIAALYWGRPRFTEDLDLVAAAGHEELLAGHPAEMENTTSTPTARSPSATAAA